MSLVPPCRSKVMDNTCSQLILRTFSEKDRVLATEKFLQLTGTTEDTKIFLRTVGIPIVDDLGVRCKNIAKKTVEYFGKHESGGAQLPRGRWVILGESNETAFCLVPERSWSVWLVDRAGLEQDTYVNASIQMFGCFLAHYRIFCDKFNPDAEVSVASEVAELERQLMQLDPRGLSVESWWRPILDEMAGGLW